MYCEVIRDRIFLIAFQIFARPPISYAGIIGAPPGWPNRRGWDRIFYIPSHSVPKRPIFRQVGVYSARAASAKYGCRMNYPPLNYRTIVL